MIGAHHCFQQWQQSSQRVTEFSSPTRPSAAESPPNELLAFPTSALQCLGLANALPTSSDAFYSHVNSMLAQLEADFDPATEIRRQDIRRHASIVRAHMLMQQQSDLTSLGQAENDFEEAKKRPRYEWRSQGIHKRTLAEITHELVESQARCIAALSSEIISIAKTAMEPATALVAPPPHAVTATPPPKSVATTPPAASATPSWLGFLTQGFVEPAKPVAAPPAIPETVNLDDWPTFAAEPRMGEATAPPAACDGTPADELDCTGVTRTGRMPRLSRDLSSSLSSCTSFGSYDELVGLEIAQKPSAACAPLDILDEVPACAPLDALDEVTDDLVDALDLLGEEALTDLHWEHAAALTASMPPMHGMRTYDGMGGGLKRAPSLQMLQEQLETAAAAMMLPMTVSTMPRGEKRPLPPSTPTNMGWCAWPNQPLRR